MRKKYSEKFESIFHVSIIGMIIFDDQGKITEVNKAMRTLFTYIPQKVIKKKITEMCRDLALATKTEGELKGTSESGETKIVAYAVTTDIVKGLNLLVVRDITDERIEQKRREHFLGITSHELKSPLASIKSIAQLLKKQLKKNTSNADIYLTQISNKVDHLTRLVNDLLDVTRIRKGKLEFLYEVIDLPQLVAETTKEITYAAPEWQIEIKGEVKKEIIADRGRLAQVLRNLIWNAVKHANSTKHCIITLEETQKTYKISVKDFGPGIAREDQQKIFHLYYRAEQDEYQNSKGLGVGLYISAEIIRQMGGKLRIKSRVGHGTTFYFTLPFHPQKR